MTSAQRKPLPPMTVTDFLDWPGDGSGQTFQLVDGEARAMSPGSAAHARIQARLAALIDRHLSETGSKCSVGTEPGVTTRLRAEINLRVPDLAVTYAEDEPGQRLFPDPILLIEVLSPGNATDTWENVWAYSTIPTVREILIVHSTRVAAELLRRQADGTWPASPEQLGSDAELRLDSIGFNCPLRTVYATTHLR